MSKPILRSEVPAEDRWDLSRLYARDDDWERDLTALSDRVTEIESYPGRLAESGEVLLKYLTLTVEIGMLEERLGYYAMLRQSEDGSDDAAQSRYTRFVQVASHVGAAMSFFAPEIQQISKARMDELMAHPGVDEYSIMLGKILRYREHTLSPSEERLLALQAEANQTSRKTFSALLDVDLDFGEVETPEGPRTLTQSTFSSLQEHSDRSVRQRSFQQFYANFDGHRHTLAALLSGSVALDVYSARVRGFDSALDARLFPDNVPISVYDNLITTVREHLPLLHRYYALRARVLDLADLAVWDTKVSLVPEAQVETPYDRAVDTVIDALSPLGNEYCDSLAAGLRSGWVDKYENKGKRSGAFSAGSFVGDPYILLNYKSDTIRDVFTLAHEAGHSMHSWYSVRSNPFQHYDYTIFEAEVASTFNEQLLMKHLLDQQLEPSVRAYLLSKHLDDMLGTLFRQTMFAEFERSIHLLYESGTALTVDRLRSEYGELLTAYFGNGVHLPELLQLEGLRIPHFYRAFYVYKYATGISAAISLAERVLHGGSAEREQYFSFLKSGGSRFPIESLRLAGVDMESPEPVRSALALFARRLEELESALA